MQQAWPSEAAAVTAAIWRYIFFLNYLINYLINITYIKYDCKEYPNCLRGHSNGYIDMHFLADLDSLGCILSNGP